MEATTASALTALAAASVPGLAGHVASRILGLDAQAAREVTAASALAALGLALATVALHALHGPASLALGPFLGAQVDGLSSAMLLTVTAIGAAVARYTVRYLDGDPEQARFCRWLAYTLSAVLVLIVSNNLAMLLLGWIGTSHGLHRLLTHRRERPAALLAARKKFLISRLGDVMLLVAFALVALRFGSLEFAEIFPRLGGASQAELFPIALLLVLGAMTKSAQFPFHTWLPDSLETPTPVSALMHAGVINAGGFLLIRMSPLLAAAPGVLVPLALGGAVTALLGSVAMLAQSDVKRKYAYSTVAQMGFMMLQCGLGAFAAAALHMVGHAFYKAHAFLASGSVVATEVPGAAPRAAARRVGPLGLALAVAAGVAVVAAVATLLGVEPAAKPGLPVLGAILALATAQLLLTNAEAGLRPLASSAAIAAAVAVAYFGGVALFEHVLAGAIPSAATIPPVGWGAAGLVLVALFGIAFAVQQRLAADPSSPFARSAYVHASQGFYLGTIQNRLVERLWALPRTEGASR